MINLNDILKVANGQLFGEPGANLFTDFCLDSRNVGENQLFVALRTGKGDTHQYIEEAILNGASGVLCVEPPTCDTTDVSVLMVDNTIEALLNWSQHTLYKLQVRVVVVIGSSGKSTAVDAITRALATANTVLAGNIDVSGKLGIPLSLSRLTSNYDYAVLRLSSSIPGELAQMVEVIKPAMVVLTGIDCVHPAAFDNCDQYVEDFASVLKLLEQDALAVVNYDDDKTRELATRVQKGTTVKTVSIDRFGADVLAFNVQVGIERIGFDIRYDDERYIARWSPILGKHLLYGVLSAICVAQHVGIQSEDALKSLTEMAILPGRMALHEGINGSHLIDDSFGASYASTVAAIEWLKDVRDDGQRIFLILGDMDGFGRNSRYAHRTIGQKAVEVADYIITQGVEAALAGRSAIDSGIDIARVFTTYSTEDVVSILSELEITENDIILVKGGEQSNMEQAVAALLAYPEDKTMLVRQNNATNTRTPILRPSWIDIDAGAMASNIRIIRENLADDVTLMAVVKADAYGHGAVMTARTAVTNGAGYLGVASIAEAIELRDAGITTPILVLTYAPPETVRQAHQLNITLTVFDLEQAELFDRMARTMTGKLKVHIKLDTGMGRLGFFDTDAIRAFRHLNTLTNLEIEGIYTHFSSADDDPQTTEDQLENFQLAIRPLRAAGITVKYLHASNSPGLLSSSENHLNLVRPGLMLYGLSPSEDTPLFEGMRPVMSWKTQVLQVKEFPPGSSIGYGGTYTTRGNEKIAVLPVGYADGFRRAPYSWEYVLIHGQKAPVVGRVSMEKTTVKVSGIEGVHSGDEVVLLGQQGDESITAELIADWLETNNYEVITSILPRIPRR